MEPRRLVMIPIDKCLVCYEKSDDITYLPTNILINMGFQYCNACVEKVTKYIKTPHQVKEMFNTDLIKVKRSSGEIDDGWMLCGAAYIEGNVYIIEVNKGGLFKRVGLAETLRLQ